jgi:hypothetical protein
MPTIIPNENGETLTHFVIRVPAFEYELWIEKLRRNEPLSPEIIGLLLGRARPVFEKPEVEKDKED